MNKAKTKQPSKTALKKKLTEARREIKKQKKLIATLSERVRDLTNEIKRRDNATKKFREIEPRALIAAARIYGQWKAEGTPDMHSETAEASGRIWKAAESMEDGEFWQIIAAEKIHDFLLLMGKAESLDMDEWSKKRIEAMLWGQTRQDMAEELEREQEAREAEKAKKEQTPGEVEE